MAIRDWPATERPRERLLQQGAAALSDAELLAIFLRVGTRGKSAVDLARELLASFDGDLASLAAASARDYLRLAQALRDRPAGGDVLERVREDGVVSRFDRRSGAFIAFGADGVIRTFFRPNDGARYFERQAARAHGAP